MRSAVGFSIRCQGFRRYCFFFYEQTELLNKRIKSFGPENNKGIGHSRSTGTSCRRVQDLALFLSVSELLLLLLLVLPGPLTHTRVRRIVAWGTHFFRVRSVDPDSGGGGGHNAHIIKCFVYCFS